MPVSRDHLSGLSLARAWPYNGVRLTSQKQEVSKSGEDILASSVLGWCSWLPLHTEWGYLQQCWALLATETQMEGLLGKPTPPLLNQCAQSGLAHTDRQSLLRCPPGGRATHPDEV